MTVKTHSAQQYALAKALVIPLNCEMVLEKALGVVTAGHSQRCLNPQQSGVVAVRDRLSKKV